MFMALAGMMRLSPDILSISFSCPPIFSPAKHRNVGGLFPPTSNFFPSQFSQQPNSKTQIMSTPTTNPPMEVEIKLRLPDSTSHQKVSNLLAPFHTKTLIQENIFFDGAKSELSSNLAVLRVRFYDSNDCILSLKAKPSISEGISRVEEQEEPLDPSLGRACIAEPWRLLRVDSSEILRRVRYEFGVGGGENEKGMVCLGGFRNVRGVYEWEGLRLEVDKTEYDFGRSFEIECETQNPEKDKELIEGFLRRNGIPFSYSKVSKFEVFRSGKLPPEMSLPLLQFLSAGWYDSGGRE